MLTSREIKEVLRRERIYISKRRGQNFLIDPAVQRRIIQAARIQPNDQILEIGPGLGALTEDLARLKAKVIAVEKDKGLARVLAQQLSGYKNLSIIHQDILEFKLAPGRVKVIGNLPYYITAPIMGYLLEEQRAKIQDIFITVQQEVGERFLAKPKSKDYSALSVFIQYFTSPKIIFNIPKRSFYPQPKVDSVFVHLAMLNQPPVAVNNQEQFFKIVRSAFSQRRKTILSSLAHQFPKEARTRIQSALEQARISPAIRPEDLSLDEFARIEQAFYKNGIKFRIGG